MKFLAMNSTSPGSITWNTTLINDHYHNRVYGLVAIDVSLTTGVGIESEDRHPTYVGFVHKCRLR